MAKRFGRSYRQTKREQAPGLHAAMEAADFCEDMIEPENGGLQTDETRWAELMVSAQSGHEADYRQLLKELSGAINRYLCSRFGHHHFIEDCVQESLVAIHQARHTYDSRRRFRPWLFSIVRHKAIDSLRHQRSQQNVINNHRLEQLVDAQMTGPSTMENRVTQGLLFDALTPEHREAIILTKLNGYSTAEAAARLSISESALKVRVHRGIARLKRLAEADHP